MIKYCFKLIMTWLSIETIYEVCLPLHNAGNKVKVRPVNHFCDVTIPLNSKPMRSIK